MHFCDFPWNVLSCFDSCENFVTQIKRVSWNSFIAILFMNTVYSNGDVGRSIDCPGLYENTNHNGNTILMQQFFCMRLLFERFCKFKHLFIDINCVGTEIPWILSGSAVYSIKGNLLPKIFPGKNLTKIFPDKIEWFVDWWSDWWSDWF